MSINDIILIICLLPIGVIIILLIMAAILYASKTCIKQFIEKRISHHFEKDKSKFNNQLQKDLEKYKQTIESYNSRLNQDFTLWTIERHKLLTKLYHEINLTLSSMSQFIDNVKSNGESVDIPTLIFSLKTDCNECSKSEIKELFNSPTLNWLSKFSKEEIINQWEENKESAIKKLNEEIEKHTKITILKRINYIQNILLDANIYISDYTYKKIYIITNRMYTLTITYFINGHLIFESCENLESKIRNDHLLIGKIIRKELSGNHINN